MTHQYSQTVNNAKLDAIETAIGTAPKLRFYTGSMPANCAAAATGTLLTDTALPSDWLANAATATKAKNGTWSGSFSNNGTVGYFRLYDSAGTNCHLQGTVTATGGGGDMTLDNINAASGQNWTVNTFTINAGNT